MTTTIGDVHRASGKQAAMRRDRQHQHSSAGSASGGAASQPATTTALTRAVCTPGAVRSVATRTSTVYGESRCPGRDFEPAGSLCGATAGPPGSTPRGITRDDARGVSGFECNMAWLPLVTTTAGSRGDTDASGLPGVTMLRRPPTTISVSELTTWACTPLVAVIVDTRLWRCWWTPTGGATDGHPALTTMVDTHR